MREIIVDKNGTKQRFDNFVFFALGSETRSHIKKCIEDGYILLNGKTSKAGEKLKYGDVVTIDEIEPKSIDLSAENIDFEIVFENKNLLVINKPQGLVVHPSSGTKNGTLVNGLLYRVKDLSGINGEIRPGIVHRLDKNTSGLMLVAKNDFAHNSLSKQISTKSCVRKYMALLEGVMQKDEGVIETHIARNKVDRKKMAVCNNNEGRNAVTHYSVVRRFLHFTLVEFELKTGRTHQIRVHAKHIGHCVVGDEVYGKKDTKFGLCGQLLHSYYISFDEPSSNERLTFQIDLPEYFKNVLNCIR